MAAGTLRGGLSGCFLQICLSIELIFLFEVNLEKGRTSLSTEAVLYRSLGTEWDPWVKPREEEWLEPTSPAGLCLCLQGLNSTFKWRRGTLSTHSAAISRSGGPNKAGLMVGLLPPR